MNGELLGVRVDCVDQEKLLKQAVEWARHGEGVNISYVNAHCLNVAAKDEAYRKLINQFDLVYTDGVGVVWAGNYLQRKKFYKVTGRSWIEEFCRLCQEAGISLYLLGGKPGIAQEAQQRLRQHWQRLNIIGVSDGFFQEQSEQVVLRVVNEAKPDVLLVGMGVPRQEKWIAANRKQIPAKVCWAVGALFDYVAGIEPVVPPWMEKRALEWLWRMIVNPREKMGRYIIGTPRFIGRVLLQKCK
jgi:N-acetylglucosaminyldiphosphoundecaprenol N-acetyl-beta-D-mannosaminyltransferase